MLLRKDKGGATVDGITWKHDGDVQDVPDKLAHRLLAIKGGGYEQVRETEAPKPPPARLAEPAPAAKPPAAPPKPAVK